MTKQTNWRSILLRLSVVLAGLLVALASLALLYVVILVMQKFGGVLVLFTLGAIVAYILSPAVDRLTARLHRRWAATLAVYLSLIAILLIVGLMVFQPLVSQSSALASALNSPTTGSLRLLRQVENEASHIESEVQAQQTLVQSGQTIPAGRVRRVQAEIAATESNIAFLTAPGITADLQTAGGVTHIEQIRIPDSYVRPLEKDVALLRADYGRVAQRGGSASLASLTRSVADARNLRSQAAGLYHTVSTTPIMVLDAQSWADQHGINVNVQHSGGQVVKKVTDQGSSVLSNTAAILSQTATVLLDLTLILIISVYLVTDGAQMVDQAVSLVPDAYHRQAVSFVNSVDSILGGYLRAQIALALLAGALSGLGAAILGVPYPVVIGVSTFALQLLPVIGPTLVYVVPMVIALLFTSMPTPVVLLVYLIVMEQVVTNVIGPRINSKSVGIHPLEAMAAALIGYPLGGFLGSFLAVPIVGVAHVVVHEAYDSWRAKKPVSVSGTTNTAPSSERMIETSGGSAVAPVAGQAGGTADV